MKSTWNYPVFQEKRDEMDIRPLQYKKVKAISMYRFDDWKERHYEEKYNAMISQKREPNFYASRPWLKRAGLST